MRSRPRKSGNPNTTSAIAALVCGLLLHCGPASDDASSSASPPTEVAPGGGADGGPGPTSPTPDACSATCPPPNADPPADPRALVVTTPTTINTIVSAINGSENTSTVTLTNAAPFAVGQTILLHQTTGNGAGNYERNTVLGIDGLTLTLSKLLSHTYASSANPSYPDRAQAIVVPEYTSVTVSSGGSLTAPAWNGITGGILAFTSTTKVTVASTNGITMAGLGYDGGTSDARDPGPVTWKAPGFSYKRVTTGGSCASVCSKVIQGPNAGGGGGGWKAQGHHGTGGGGGGHKTDGGAGGGEVNGAPGQTYGDASLAQIFFGSGGGSSGYSADPAEGHGGRGGGIVIVWGHEIELQAPNAINVAGNPGTIGNAEHGGGGGGAGGSILLSHTAAVTGGDKVTVAGGAGGGVQNMGQPEVGGAGGIGRSLVAP